MRMLPGEVDLAWDYEGEQLLARPQGPGVEVGERVIMRVMTRVVARVRHLGLRMAGVGILPSQEGRNISRFIICSLSMNTSLLVIFL